MANSTRLVDFTAKTSPASTDIIYVGDMSNSGNEVKSTINQILTTADTVNVKLAGSTMTGPLILNANPATNLGAATKQYVDSAVSAGGGILPYTNVTSTSQTMVANNAYGANNVALVTFTLPVTAAVGTELEVSYVGTGGWAIAQNSGQFIRYGIFTTTTGVGGSLSSSDAGDNVVLKCVVANTTWNVKSSQGNLTYV